MRIIIAKYEGSTDCKLRLMKGRDLSTKRIDNGHNSPIQSVKEGTKLLDVVSRIRQMNHRTIFHHRCVGRLGTWKAVLHYLWVQRQDWAVHAKLGAFSLDDYIPIVEPELCTSFYWVNSFWRWARFWGSWTFCRIGCHDPWLVQISELLRFQDLSRFPKLTRSKNKNQACMRIASAVLTAGNCPITTRD